MIDLRQALPDGPLDIVGDVHGELSALHALIRRLGGDPERARLARPMVFLGDLVDRGPDSPGVVALVRRLVDSGQAQALLGNHELNLLQRERKEGNGWFYGDADDGFLWRDEAGSGHHLVFDSRMHQPAGDPALLAFFASLPLVLERPDLRLVHACWDPDAVAALPARASPDELAAILEARVDAALAEEGVLDAARAERGEWLDLRDPGTRPDRHLPAEQERNLRQQNDNPLRVLTSGRERRVAEGEHFFIGGRWRFVARDPWWEGYEDDVAVVVGHYWRRRSEPTPGRADVFQAPSPWHWAGPRGRVFCVDYSVGRRFLQRATGGPGPEGFLGGLAALRWPERQLVFDDREAPVATRGFGEG